MRLGAGHLGTDVGIACCGSCFMGFSPGLLVPLSWAYGKGGQYDEQGMTG